MVGVLLLRLRSFPRVQGMLLTLAFLQAVMMVMTRIQIWTSSLAVMIPHRTSRLLYHDVAPVWAHMYSSCTL